MIVEMGQSRDDRLVVAKGAVAVQLEKLLEDQIEIIARLGPLLMPRDLDDLPGVEVGIDLAFERGQLAAEPADLFGDLGRCRPRRGSWRIAPPSRRGAIPSRGSVLRNDNRVSLALRIRAGSLAIGSASGNGLNSRTGSRRHSSRTHEIERSCSHAITTSAGRVLGSPCGSGSSRKIRIVRNRVMNSWRLLNRSAGRFWIILRIRSLNSGVTSLL